MNGYDFLFSPDINSIAKLGIITYGVVFAIVVIIITIIERRNYN